MAFKLLLLSTLSASLWAAPLTITVSGVGSGSFGGRPFTATQFTVTLTANGSDAVKPLCCDSLDLPPGSPATVAVQGLGMATINDNQTIFVFPRNGVIGLAHFNDGDLLDFKSSELTGYRFGFAVGPLTGTPSFVGACPGANCSGFQTSAGPFNFSSVSSVTFQVVLAPPVLAPGIVKIVDFAAGNTRLAPGMAIEITGMNLGSSASDAPAITIAGKPAPLLSFISPMDVVVQIPVDAAVGDAPVVAVYKGMSSSPVNITIDTFAPEIFTHAGTSLPVFYGASGNPVDGAHPATPNARLYLLAAGLGPTNPPQVTNTPATAPSPTTSPVQVMVGNKLIMPDYAGLFPSGTPGTYQVTFTLPQDVVPGAQPVTLMVGGKTSNMATLQVSPAVPRITAVVNGATFKATPAAPNSFISIFGENLGLLNTAASIFPATSFNDVSVLFNGVPAQLYFVFGTLGQINLVVPSNLPETGTVLVQVKTAQGTSAPFTLQMGTADVGLFRIPDPSKPGRNNGAILFANTVGRVMPASMAMAIGFPNCDGGGPATVCGQPAAAGDSLQIFLTGLGKATPDGEPTGQPLPPGSVAPVNGVPLYRTIGTPTVTIGGLAAPVLFSGITPGNAALYQINVTVPQGVAIDDDVMIVITMPNGSKDAVTIGTRTK